MAQRCSLPLAGRKSAGPTPGLSGLTPPPRHSPCTCADRHQAGHQQNRNPAMSADIVDQETHPRPRLGRVTPHPARRAAALVLRQPDPVQPLRPQRRQPRRGWPDAHRGEPQLHQLSLHPAAGPTDLPLQEAGPHRWSLPELLNAIRGYQYQTCEHPSWETSEAKAFCEALQQRLISMLPGYRNGPWLIPPTAPQRPSSAAAHCRA